MENSITEKICRLCLGNVECELKENIHLSALQMLHLCLPEMDLSMCSDCAFCVDCFNCLKGIYIFKKKCLQTEEKLRLYLENCDPSNVNLRQIVECVSVVQEKDIGICRSCLNVSADSISVQVDNSNCGPILMNMLMTCIPEMDLALFDNPIICSGCAVLLKKFYSFKSKCLQTEEEIVSFKEDTQSQIVSLVKLVKSKNFTENNIEQGSSVCKIKIEIEDNHIEKLELFPESKTKTETVNVFNSNLDEKPENFNLNHIEKLDVFPESKMKTQTVNGSECNSDEKPENFNLNGNFHFIDCGFIEKNEGSFEDSLNEEDAYLTSRLQALSENAISPHTENLTWHTCETCSYQSKWKHHLERHKQVHEVQPNRHKSFKCFKCGFVSPYKHALLMHSTLEHGNWFKCGECKYQTKWKRTYNQHLLNHKGGQIWHHCELCAYKTKWKYHLKRHMVTHQ